MQVYLRFKNETHDFKLPKNANVAILMEQINKELMIPPEKQKLIYRGRPLKSPTDELSDGMKLLLTAMASPIITAAENKQIRSSFMFRPQIIDTLKERYHLDVIEKGLPEGVTKTSQYQQSIFPASPLFVRNSKGERATLAFESDALFSVDDSSNAERIFISDILNFSLIQIQSNPGYYALGLMTKKGNKWFYFIPNQFTQLIKAALNARY